MHDSRMAWLSVGASRTNLDATSSASLLHSIYGSQASQLPFSDYDSEASLPATQSEFLSRSVSPAAQRRYLSRPKSSPAATLLAREQQKKMGRPGSAMAGQRVRPATARSTGGGRMRPGSAAPLGRQRPSSARPGVGGAAARTTRPRTALGVRRRHGSVVLLDLEEEGGEGVGVEMGTIRDTTTPVRLTRVPEYFNFWDMKPIQRREFGAPEHKRKQWQRPKSDYGNRFMGTRRRGEGEGEGKRRWEGEEGGGGLGSLVETDGSVDGKGRGRGTDGDEGEGDNSNQTDLDGKGGDKNQGHDDSSLLNGKDIDSAADSRRRRGRDDSNGRDRNSWKDKRTNNKAAWGEEDGSADAENDRYFKEHVKDDLFLPNIPTTTSLVNVEDLTGNSKDNGFGGHLPELYRQVNEENRSPAAAAKGDKQNVASARQALLPVVASVPPTAAPKKAIAATSWMDGRSASHKTTRFELPMDIKTLEAMSPLQYLRKHSVISDQRLSHCSKVFTKLDRNKDSKLDKEELLSGLVEVHHHCITNEQASSALELVRYPPDLLVDLRMFAAISCIAERMYQLNFLPTARREVIEMVDFEALEWKLRGCTISTSLRTLFSRL